MRGIGVLEDGFVFTDEELERGSPRFWWGLRKRAAYDRVLARRGMARRDGDEAERDDTSLGSDDMAVPIAAGAAAVVMMEADEKKTERGGSWWSGWGGGGDSGSSDGGGGGASDSGGGSDGGGGGSGE